MFEPRTRHTRFCSDKCRYRKRDRARYAADPEGMRADSLARFHANPEPRRERQRAYAKQLREGRPPKPCRVCGAALENRHHWYCPGCRPANHRKAPLRNVVYGRLHRRLRAWWKPQVDTGRVKCSRCAALIDPREPWDLGHDDDDASRYTGPEHRACNRATAGRPNYQQSRTGASRQW